MKKQSAKIETTFNLLTSESLILAALLYKETADSVFSPDSRAATARRHLEAMTLEIKRLRAIETAAKRAEKRLNLVLKYEDRYLAWQEARDCAINLRIAIDGKEEEQS